MEPKLEIICPYCKTVINFTGGRFADYLMDSSKPIQYRCGACNGEMKIYSKIDVELVAIKDGE